MRASKRSDSGDPAAAADKPQSRVLSARSQMAAGSQRLGSPSQSPSGALVARRAEARGESQIEGEIVGDAEETPSESRKESSTNSNRLVFGLNPRANKVKHDEYVERRVKQHQSVVDSDSKARPTTPIARHVVRQPQDSSGPKRVLVRQRSESPERGRATSQAVSHQVAAPNAEPTKVRRREDKYSKSSPISSMAAADSSKPKGEPTGNSPNRTPSTTESGHHQAAAAAEASSKNDTNESAPRTQFNIPPPPKLNSGSTIKSSIISYAKSRIYDKPSQQQSARSSPQANTAAAAAGVLSDSSNIPESILSGFKPPKQVNVSKARERWEGGEPFAKCKSRQRLAHQAANKSRLLYGGWSMSSSVVATQQLQFQQLAERAQNPSNYPSRLSSSFAASANRIGFAPDCADADDNPVKILTRGSVLERVQQYERAPSTGNLRGSLSTGSLSSSASSTSSASLSSSSSSCSSIDSTGSLSPLADGSSSTAECKSASLVETKQVDSLKKSPPDHQIGALGRRFSFSRRRSSASTSPPAIPKFYHPNGKPNTYEIELQKKNIVACFYKFTDRRALLGAPAYKRHFHSIALACGFSEYFKEPLYRYVRYHMTSSNVLLQHNSGAGGATQSSLLAARKQSATTMIAHPNTLGRQLSSDQNSTPRPAAAANQLNRAASIDNSSVEKLQSQNYISCEQFLTCWCHLISSAFDLEARFVHLLTLGQRNYLLPDDFVPLIQSVIDDHPGLKFLRTAPDFHMRYIQTVIARIYFNINRSWTGKISLCELRRSNLLRVLETLSREEDINQVTDYFSYEHFYVIYCKFWSLDQDHDLLISKEDLAKHNDAAISSRIIDRIFTGVVSRRIQETGKMSYSDFVWFLLAEEDKKHPRSIEYWFRLMDIDGDGYISMYEMEYFYYEQTRRLEMMNIEALPFLDSACQILDLINPKEKSKISLSDLKKTKLATIFFDTFINLEKYLEHESREFVSSRDLIQNGKVVSDWDRYASETYEALVSEESSV